MNIKKFTLATVVGGFGMWVVSGLWHDLIVPAFYSETGASHEGIGILLVAYLVLSLLMAYMYPLVYRGGRPIIEGLRFGMVIGVLWVFPHELAMAGAHGDSISYVFKNAAWHMVEQGVGGIIIGFVYGRLQAVAQNQYDCSSDGGDKTDHLIFLKDLIEAGKLKLVIGAESIR